MIAQVLLALSILIVLHEWGHFQMARWFGIKVEKFYLFFDAWGKRLFKFKKGDTEYGVGWLPLGGYVKISGMIDESMDKEFLKEAPKSYEFRSKPAWQRLLVMIGGVTVNVILGVLIYSGIKFVYGEKYHTMESASHGIIAFTLGEEVGFRTGDVVVAVNGQKPERFEDLLKADVLMNASTITVERDGAQVDIVLPDNLVERLKEGFIGLRVPLIVDSVIAGSNAEKGGLKKGDVIKAINDSSIAYFHEVVPFLQRRKGERVQVLVERPGGTQTLEIDVVGEGKKNAGTIGFKPLEQFSYQHFGLGESLARGSKAAFSLLVVNVQAFGKMFSGEINPAKTVSGPIGIAAMFGSVWDWERFWSLTGALSMILAFMNILPIPALDGGHVFFLLIEMVRGKPLSDKALERAQMVGFAILLTLMVLIFGNDIYQAIVN